MPPPSSGLVAWQNARDIVLADGAAVSSWADSGPNGYAATQATGTKQPAYRANAASLGFPGVQFDGGDNLGYAAAGYLAATNNAASALVATVARFTTIPGAGVTNNTFAICNGSTATNSRMRGGLVGAAFQIGGRRLDADANQVVNAGTALVNTTYMLTFEMDWANNDARVWVGRTLTVESLAFQTAGTTSATNAQNASIGSRGDGTIEWMLGFLFEVVTYKPTLSSTDRTALWDWLEYQWFGGPAPGVPNPPPPQRRIAYRR